MGSFHNFLWIPGSHFHMLFLPQIVLDIRNPGPLMFCVFFTVKLANQLSR